MNFKEFEIGDKVEIILDYYYYTYSTPKKPIRYFGTITDKIKQISFILYFVEEADCWYFENSLREII